MSVFVRRDVAEELTHVVGIDVHQLRQEMQRDAGHLVRVGLGVAAEESGQLALDHDRGDVAVRDAPRQLTAQVGAQPQSIYRLVDVPRESRKPFIAGQPISGRHV